jgi:hypothetical protein
MIAFMRRRTRPASRAPKAAVRAASVLLALSLAGCATPAGNTAEAADADAIAAQAAALGIAPELVYTTDVEGYDLAPQSVGPSGSDGMSATWVGDGTGAMVTLRTERGELTEATCVAMPLWDAFDAPVTCTDEDGVWHRSGGGIHEYAAVSGDAIIRVIGGNDAPQDDLRSAAQAVHVPSDAELERLFSAVPERPTAPVERGDIPENGDGAPVDPVGPGG